jgi:hypothetical protein
MKKNFFFIVPANDGEAVEIRKILQTAKISHVVTRQAWGATWVNLEPEVVVAIEGFISANPSAVIYGVELGGPARWGAINIDHHIYRDENRSNEKSSIEQVAALLGVELTRHQLLIAANDKGYIPAMKAMGATENEIKIVRAQDRLAQGVTPDQEAQAVADIQSAEIRGHKWLVRCPKGSTSAVTDRIFGQYAELLTVDGVNGKWIYFGPRHMQFYAITEGGTTLARWAGGDPKNGFSGVEKPTEETQIKILEFFWKE